jgi:hypothetical protein
MSEPKKPTAEDRRLAIENAHLRAIRAAWDAYYRAIKPPQDALDRALEAARVTRARAFEAARDSRERSYAELEAEQAEHPEARE